MNSWINMDKLSLLKILLAWGEALEELEPHFSQRRQNEEIRQAIKELEP